MWVCVLWWEESHDGFKTRFSADIFDWQIQPKKSTFSIGSLFRLDLPIETLRQKSYF